MKLLTLLVFLWFGLSGCRLHEPAAAVQTNKVQIPKLMEIEYSVREGEDFILSHGTDCRTGETRTAYILNYRFVTNLDFKKLNITDREWASFRNALEGAGCYNWKNQEFDKQKVKGFWTIRIEYSDAIISASEADSPTLEKNFSPIRDAVRRLTNGQIN